MVAQSSLSLPANPALLQSDLYNPALFNRKGAHLGLLSFYADIYHSSKAYGKFTTKQNGRRVLLLSALIQDLESQNKFSANGSWDILSVRFVTDRWKIGLDHGIRMHSTIEYPRELVELAVKGNEPFLGETISFGPDFEYGLYRATGIVFSYFKKNWFGGVRLKWLNGLKYLHSQRTEAILHTDTSFYATTIYTDYLVQNSDVIVDKEDQLLPYGLNTYSGYPFLSKNNGWAFDIGFSGILSKNWHYALSMSDLGFIRWKEKSNILRSNEQIHYDGVQTNDIIQISRIDVQGAVDTLSNILQLEKNPATFTNRYTGYYRGMVRYTGLENWSFAIQSLYSQMMLQPLVFGIQSNYSIDPRWNLGINMSNHYGKFNIGFHVYFSTPHIDVYCFYDNVARGLNPYHSNLMHFRVGLNIHFPDSNLRTSL